MKVTVTVSVGAKHVPVDQVRDRRVATAFAAAGRDVGDKLGEVVCPTHDKPAGNVRVHFDKAGNADLRYDACCPELEAKIRAALG